jgi:ABC-2 type transport system ATP-binding protein
LVTVLGALTPHDREQLVAAGLEVAPVSLQQLIVRTTQHTGGEAAGIRTERDTDTKEALR